MPYHGLLASQASRLEALKSRHSALSNKIELEQSHYSFSDHQLRQMKQERLFMKEEIEELQDELQEASSA